MSFNSFNLHPQVADGIRAAGYTEPTPIQKMSIPIIMQGRDVMGLAQTGTGKTAAFALPILHKLLKGQRKDVRALVIAPTRELAEQIHESFVSLGAKTGLRSVTVYGGVNINPQIGKLKRGVEIVVACPGRLLDHMKQNTIDLSQLDMLVLDEADRMFDMGFLPDIRRIVKQLPQKRQTLLFSATMPKEIRHLAHEVLRDPETVQVDTVAPAKTVSHALYPISQHLKTDLLLKLLELTDTESVLVFTRTKHRAKRLGQQLEKKGYRAASLQGNLSQSRRQSALNGFRDGSHQILVATDIAARGIDVSQVSHVINFDIPDTAEAYIHRIGRTGRAARTGDAFTMVTSEDKAMVLTIERTLGNSLERREVDCFDYSKSAPERQSRFAKPACKQANKPTKLADKEKGAKPSGTKRPNRRRRTHRPAQTGMSAPAAR